MYRGMINQILSPLNLENANKLISRKFAGLTLVRNSELWRTEINLGSA